MASAPHPVRALAHHLHAVQPLDPATESSPKCSNASSLNNSSAPKLWDWTAPPSKSIPTAQAPSKEAGPQAIGRSRGGLTTKIHMVAADARTAIIYALSPGQDHDGPHGRQLLRKMGNQNKRTQGQQLRLFLVADRAYEGAQTRQLALALGYTPHIPPKQNRKQPWTYDRHIYKRRNEIERLFRRLKAYRRIYTRYDKLDVVFLAFITLALIHDTLKA